ncbi:sulfite exporter TauE/SafE family protein [Saccharicrinis aurantiacus]|uniref:sulfite exporter TauE/SafE family protein n=1 Tax=Saccharicrinis aurantiacus TaxID=1849719 RepID=UPI00249209FD|nr:sulfite exporter TauE/SafE family protein [Saccharicrinis aurantiacus]
MFFYSSIEPIYYILPIVGFIIGLFATVLGGGGGFFFLPILTIVLGVPTQTAVITSLVATLPIGLVGTYGHLKQNNIDFRTGLPFVIFGLAGAFIGAYITSIVSPQLLKSCFGAYTIILSLSIAYKALLKTNNSNLNQTPISRNIKSSIYGLFGGAISGSFGTSGTGPVLAGLLSLKLPLRLVIGTSLFVVLINTIASITAHLLIGKIDLTLILFLTAGSIIGAFIGPKIISKTNTNNKESKARFIYAVVLFTVGIIMILK